MLKFRIFRCDEYGEYEYQHDTKNSLQSYVFSTRQEYY